MIKHAAIVGLLLALLLGVGEWARAEAPTRVVSVGGALTEIIYRLGAEGLLVGVDSTSQWPAAAEALPEVGYQRALAAEGLLSLAPDLVLVTEAAGPPAVLEQLRSTGVRLVVIDAEPSPTGLVQKIDAVAAAIGRPDVGARLAEALREDLAAVTEAVAAAPANPRVVFLLSAARGAPLAAGRDTAADAAIRLAGGVNPLAGTVDGPATGSATGSATGEGGMVGYKPLNAEALIAAAPQVLLLGQRTLDGLGGVDGVLALPGVAETPAGRERRIVAMDDLLLLGFGPRLPQAITELAAQLHPGLSLPALAPVPTSAPEAIRLRQAAQAASALAGAR